VTLAIHLLATESEVGGLERDGLWLIAVGALVVGASLFLQGPPHGPSGRPQGAISTGRDRFIFACGVAGAFLVALGSLLVMVAAFPKLWVVAASIVGVAIAVYASWRLAGAPEYATDPCRREDPDRRLAGVPRLAAALRRETRPAALVAPPPIPLVGPRRGDLRSRARATANVVARVVHLIACDRVRGGVVCQVPLAIEPTGQALPGSEGCARTRWAQPCPNVGAACAARARTPLIRGAAGCVGHLSAAAAPGSIRDSRQAARASAVHHKL
jgi:hypothetical protein